MGRLFQHTIGEVADWKIGLTPPVQLFSLSLVDFLVAVIENQISPEGFPASFDYTVIVPNAFR